MVGIDAKGLRLIRACFGPSGLAALLLVAISLLAPSCGFKAQAAESVVDALGRTVAPGPATRILTLGSDVTEIVHALGAGERVVGVDRGSKYPEAVASRPNVGYRRQLSVEGLVALNPDLILASEDSGPPEAIEVLKSLAVPTVFVPQDNSPEGIERKITLIAAALGREEAGKAVSAEVLAAFDAADVQVGVADAFDLRGDPAIARILRIQRVHDADRALQRVHAGGGNGGVRHLAVHRDFHLQAAVVRRHDFIAEAGRDQQVGFRQPLAQ